uniref:Uncharacterized protein n=1 Tax=Parascaris equorum TaxID=6256 RepID=A0A914RNF3_PAREQ
MVEMAWIAYNCILVAISASLVVFVSPVAAGSGSFALSLMDRVSFFNAI